MLALLLPTIVVAGKGMRFENLSKFWTPWSNIPKATPISWLQRLSLGLLLKEGPWFAVDVSI